MTRKDYELIAAALQKAARCCETDNQRRGVERARNALIEALAADNPAFNRRRFEAACVPGANVRARKPITEINDGMGGTYRPGVILTAEG